MTVDDGTQARWRLLSYLLNSTSVRAFSDRSLTRSENETFKKLEAVGAVEYEPVSGWRVTVTGRLEYYALRACRVPGCPYLEKRGSRQGDFVLGRFVCPAHATTIGQRAARAAFEESKG
jgi:hypothetical protein